MARSGSIRPLRRRPERWRRRPSGCWRRDLGHRTGRPDDRRSCAALVRLRPWGRVVTSASRGEQVQIDLFRLHRVGDQLAKRCRNRSFPRRCQDRFPIAAGSNERSAMPLSSHCLRAGGDHELRVPAEVPPLRTGSWPVRAMSQFLTSAEMVVGKPADSNSVVVRRPTRRHRAVARRFHVIAQWRDPTDSGDHDATPHGYAPCIGQCCLHVRPSGMSWPGPSRKSDLFDGSNHERTVVSAESKAIGNGIVDPHRASRMRDVIEIAFWIGRFELIVG